MLKEEKEIGWYKRIAIKTKEYREREDYEDITLEEWIDYIKRFKEDERRREEAERL
jgi:hypothetical protein